MGKADGSYAQTRGSSYPQAFAQESIGLPIELFRDATGKHLVAEHGVTSSSDVLLNE